MNDSLFYIILVIALVLCSEFIFKIIALIVMGTLGIVFATMDIIDRIINGKDNNS